MKNVRRFVSSLPIVSIMAALTCTSATAQTTSGADSCRATIAQDHNVSVSSTASEPMESAGVYRVALMVDKTMYFMCATTPTGSINYIYRGKE